ncbi:MAG: hypothetical protein ACSHWQ_04685 [Spongiibacteraceae bacterium]
MLVLDRVARVLSMWVIALWRLEWVPLAMLRLFERMFGVLLVLVFEPMFGVLLVLVFGLLLVFELRAVFALRMLGQRCLPEAALRLTLLGVEVFDFASHYFAPSGEVL